MAKENQKHAPLFEAMRLYANSGVMGYHTPGHKQGKGMHAGFFEAITPQGLAMEVSLMDELDDLHEPHGCIQTAQQLAAELYGADESFFFVNGTTGAIHAMLLSAAGPGETVILPRNAHRSVLGALMLSGARPVYVQPEIDHEAGIAMGITPESILQAIQQHPEAKAVLLVSPTYYGIVSDLEAVARIVHEHSMVLLVDEAHGAHLIFHPDLPVSALEAGADLVAQSTHKLLGAMTQASMLHCKGGRVAREKIRTMASLLQSTSPNYLLLASLDIARMQMATEGEALLSHTLEIAAWARQEINKIEGLHCFGTEKIGRAGCFALDITKLTVSVVKLGITGAEAVQKLRGQYKVQAELSDLYNVLFLFTIGDGKKEAAYLVEALRKLSADIRNEQKQERALPCFSYFSLPEQALLPREALFAEKETIPFRQAAGRISAETIMFYPPGIPLIGPGEVIEQELVSDCLKMQAAGLKIVGPDDVALKWIKVVK